MEKLRAQTFSLFYSLLILSLHKNPYKKITQKQQSKNNTYTISKPCYLATS
uniref:Uncharacterized protein n=1 Tax=Rhizophora mucronata TaxID=61149 RepID=A0A2P2NL47_RHIMU